MKNFFNNGNVIRLMALIVLLFVAVSCSKDSGPIVVPGKSYNNDITGFIFKRSDNPSLTADCTPFIDGDLLYITVPEGTDITSLKPELTVSPKSTITINGSPVQGSPGAMNFSEIVRIKVTAEAGNSRTYRLLVQPGRDNIDRMVYAFMSKFSIPGVSVAISKDERVVYKTGLGFAITEDETRTKPNHLFRLASISKQFTTLCIMKLIEAGKLTVESKVFGEGGILESEFSNVPPKASTVTIRHLLEHTSGWRSDPDPMFTSSFKGQTLDQRIVYVLNSAQNDPGTAYSYFNMGFGILGKVVEKLSGKNFEAFLKEVLLEAGVNDIHVGGDRAARRANEVVYYSQSGTNGYGNEMDVIAAAGGIIASTEQMMKVLFHIDGLTDIPDIISASTRTTMLTPSSVYNRYALGWRTNHSYYPNSWYHGGNLAGTAVIWVMGPSINCVILCNSRSYITGFDDELYGLIKDIINSAHGMVW